MGTWLQDHLLYNAGNESPEYFHIWAGVHAIACQLGRRVWIDEGYRKIYPNNYICNVAVSASIRKGTPRDVVVDMITLAKTSAIIIPQKIGPERLIYKMIQGVSGYADEKGHIHTVTKPTIISLDELSSVMTTLTIQSGMAEILHSCYTCPDKYDYSTFGRDDEIIPEPCINILASTTPTCILRLQGMLEEGFFGRFIWMFQDEKARSVPRSSVTPEMERIRQSLIARLIRYQTLNGVVTLDTGAGKLYDTWYHTLGRGGTPLLDAFLGRIHHHVLKTAIILSVGSEQFPTITTDHIQTAIELVTVVKKFLPGIIDQVSEGGEVGVQKTIMYGIETHGKEIKGGIEWDQAAMGKWLYGKKDCTNDTIAKALITLEQFKMINMRKEGRKKIWTLLKPAVKVS